jgi:hypothetical protein
MTTVQVEISADRGSRPALLRFLLASMETAE